MTELAIETQRLRLLPQTPAGVLAMLDGPRALEAHLGMPVAEELVEPADLDQVSPAWLEMVKASTAADPWLHGFAIVDRESSIVIGSLGFKGPPDEAGMVEIAYGVAPAYRCRGYATEATAAGVEFALGSEQVKFVRAHTLPENNASCRVLTKCGFELLGEVTDPEDGRVWRWERRP